MPIRSHKLILTCKVRPSSSEQKEIFASRTNRFIKEFPEKRPFPFLFNCGIGAVELIDEDEENTEKHKTAKTMNNEIRR